MNRMPEYINPPKPPERMGKKQPSELALQKAAGAWCQPETSSKIMDVELATAFAEILDKYLPKQLPIDPIEYRDSFVIIDDTSESNIYECIGTDGGLVWYAEDDYSVPKSVDPGSCIKILPEENQPDLVIMKLRKEFSTQAALLSSKIGEIHKMKALIYEAWVEGWAKAAIGKDVQFEEWIKLKVGDCDDHNPSL